MFTIAICDDSKEIQQGLSGIIDKAFLKEPAVYDKLLFSNGEEMLNWLDANERTIDLLFLDIEMPGKNGVEIKSILEKNDRVSRVIFATSHYENMQDAFGAKVIGFMLKPLQSDEVLRRLENAYRDYKDDSVVEISKEVYVRKSGISYIKSDGNYCDFYGINGKTIKSIRMPLLYYKNLFGDSFIQIHKSYIVNAYDIKRCERNSVALSGGVTLNIGRSYVESFKKEYRDIAMKNAHDKL